MTRVHSEPNLTKCLPSPSLTSFRVSNWKSNAFQQKRKVEIFVSCTDLVQLDTFSKSDPMCVMSVKKLGHWAEYGRTEYIPNTLRPKVSRIEFCLNPIHYSSLTALSLLSLSLNYKEDFNVC